MKKLLISMLLISPIALAENSLIVGGISHHIGDNTYKEVDNHDNETGLVKQYNEVNTSLGGCLDSICLVAMKLSYDNWGAALYNESYYDVISTDYFKGGLRLGVVTGYQHTPINSLLIPLLQPIITINSYNGTKVQLGLMFSDVLVVTLNFKY